MNINRLANLSYFFTCPWYDARMLKTNYPIAQMVE